MLRSYSYDVFISHSSRDKSTVRDIATRLANDGLRVWLDEWEIKPGDSIPAKIEEGLEASRALILCMSANTFGSDWAQLEGGTFRFRDPLNRERRFIPVRLDNAPLRGSLAQLLYIDWMNDVRENAYASLLEACRPPEAPSPTAQAELRPTQGGIESLKLQFDNNSLYRYASWKGTGGLRRAQPRKPVAPGRFAFVDRRRLLCFGSRGGSCVKPGRLFGTHVVEECFDLCDRVRLSGRAG
jgi:hypothetical protein